jgi:hypothetical protein
MTKFVSSGARELARQLDLLWLEFSSTAEWRRAKAVEFPDDGRNGDAAKLLDRLAATADQVEAHVVRAYVEAWGDGRDGDEHAEMLRGVGFNYWPQSATVFLRDFIGRVRERRDAA